MKPLKNESLRYNEPCIKIFLENIKSIVEIMGSGDNVVQISDEEFEYDSIDELTQKQKRVKMLSLSARSPYISLDFKKLGGASLYASHDAEAQFLKTKEILLKKKRWFSFLISWKLYYISLGLAIAFFLILTQLKNIIPEDSFRLYFISFSVLPLLLVLQLIGDSGYFTSIHLEYSSNKQSFWVRNKDEILILLLVALFSWLLGKYL